MTFRAVVFTYRLGEIIEILILVVLWLAIYGKANLISGFTRNEMITYVLVGNIFSLLVRDFTHHIFSEDIISGKLSFFLVKPLSHLRYFIASTIGRTMHVVTGVVSQLLVILCFHAFIVVHVSPPVIGLIVVMLILARINEILVNYLRGMVGFWTDEVEPVQGAVSQVQRFLTGGYFPLSLLPLGLAVFTYGLPFAYYFFIPMQLFLGKMSLADGARGLVIQIAWIGILYLLIKLVWQRGLKRYEGVNA